MTTFQATTMLWQLLLKTPDPVIILGCVFVLMLPKILKEVRKLITRCRQENTKRMLKTLKHSSSHQFKNPPGTYNDSPESAAEQ